MTAFNKEENWSCEKVDGIAATESSPFPLKDAWLVALKVIQKVLGKWSMGKS